MSHVNAGHIHREAGYLIKRCRMTSGPWGNVDNFLVASFPQSAYSLPSFISTTATPEERRALSGLLGDLWQLNEDHVGMPIIEANICFSLTGIHERMEGEFVQWSETYFSRRVSKQNPKDKGKPFKTFARLYEEFVAIFGGREHAIDYLVLDKALYKVLWLLFEHTWRDCIQVMRGDDHDVAIQFSLSLPIKQAKLLAEECGFGRDDLGDFMDTATASELPADFSELRTWSEVELHDHIEILSSDVHEMRPFLVRNFRPEKTLVQLRKDLFMAMDWTARHGVIDLFFGHTEHAVRGNLQTRTTPWNIRLSQRGVLIDGYRPWITAANLGAKALAMNAFLLEAIHDRLFEFYDQIDVAGIRERAQAVVDSEEIDDEVLAVSSHDVPDDTPDEPVEKRLRTARLRPLRLEKLLSILAGHFGCEVRPGKGDETTVFRSEGRIFCFGRPKQVQPELLKQVLKRLRIPARDWLNVVYG